MKYILLPICIFCIVQAYEQGHADAMRQAKDMLILKQPVILEERQKLDNCTSEVFVLREFLRFAIPEPKIIKISGEEG